jgi:hypothetical protein
MKFIEIAFICIISILAFASFLVVATSISGAGNGIVPCGYSAVDGKFNGVVLVNDNAIFVNSYHGSTTGVLYTLEGDVIEGDTWTKKHPEHRDWVVSCIQAVN